MKLNAVPHTGFPAYVEIVLSKRNLLTLLAKLDGYPVDSQATIMFDNPTEGTRLVVKAEADHAHYGERKSGAMHPDTERAIAAWESPAGKQVVVLEWDDVDDNPHTEVFATDVDAVSHKEAIRCPRTFVHRTVR